MKVLLLTTHPKHVHMFREFARKISAEKGSDVLSLYSDKEIVKDLLDYYGVNAVKIGSNTAGIIAKLVGYIGKIFRSLVIAWKYKPDVIIGQADPIIGFLSFILRKPSFVFPDTETASKLHKFTFPFCELIITSNNYQNEIKYKNLKLDNYFELAYLHPNVFKPSKDIREFLNLLPNEKYTIIRFVSWDAHHDIGHKGLSEQSKEDAVKAFLKFGKVFISSEKPLSKKLFQYAINIPFQKMHDALAGASLFYGESATMAAESAVLGTPAIYLDNEGRGYTDELESKYNLLFNFSESLEDQKRSIDKGIYLLNDANTDNIWNERKNKMLKSKIDFSSFLFWFIKNYPNSYEKMKENPDYQNRFK